MDEQQDRRAGAAGGGVREERLEALYTAAYPRVRPPERLRRRVAGLAAQRGRSVARCGVGWMPWSQARLVAGGIALSLVAAAGVLLWQAAEWAPVSPRPRVAGVPAPGPRSHGEVTGVESAAAVPDRQPVRRRVTGGSGGWSKDRQPRGSVMGGRQVSKGGESAGGALALRNEGHGGRSSPLRPDDMAYVNQAPEAAFRTWARLSADERERVEARVRQNVRVRDDFVQVPFPRLADASGRQIAAAVEGYRREAAVVDPRLSREVTVQLKATALSDLCDHLREDTGIQLTASPSVADEKVTVFCRAAPLRDVMRQLSRPFGYTWLRTKREEKYRYELVQDLKSQLMEEELRNRDRNAALIALDQEMQRYRSLAGLSPDEALARARTAAPEQKALLDKLAHKGWAAIQMYYRLSRSDLAALWAGQPVSFGAPPERGEQPLPPEIARGVMQSWRDWRFAREGNETKFAPEKDIPGGLPPAQVPEAHATVTFRVDRGELGQFTLDAGSGIRIGGHHSVITDNLALGLSPAVRNPENAQLNAKLSRDPAFRLRVTVRPTSSCRAATEPDQPALANAQRPTPNAVPRVTSADVLEALHRATGMNLVADYYTRLYPLGEVTVQDQPLFEALNRVADAMRLRWARDGEAGAGAGGGWLQFRSASFFHDRLKEVPNRLLSRWAGSRKQNGALTLDDLIEIAGLSEPQLDSKQMADGAKECWGLKEWSLARNRYGLRPYLRYLATLTPAQRQAARSGAGLPFTKLTLAQQQGFISLALGEQPERFLASLEELTGATLRVDYTLPGWYEWRRPPAAGEPKWRELLPPPVRERTRGAALQAALRLEPLAEDSQVTPTTAAVSLVCSWGSPETRVGTHLVRGTADGSRIISYSKRGNSESTDDSGRSGDE